MKLNVSAHGWRYDSPTAGSVLKMSVDQGDLTLKQMKADNVTVQITLTLEEQMQIMEFIHNLQAIDEDYY